MSLWIVSHVPSWLLLVILVIVLSGGTVAILAGVRRFFPGLADGEHNDVARMGFAVIGPVYGFLTGFIIVVMFGQIGAADVAVRTEATSAVQMVRLMDAFDQPDRDRIRQALLDYERAAVAEWPEAARGHVTTDAEDALRNLFATYGSIEAAGDRQASALSSSLDSLKQLSTARSDRLIMARTNTGPPWSLWAVVLLTSALVLGVAVIFGETKARMHYGMAAAVGALVAVVLFLLTELAHPFLGEMSTTPEPLRAAIETTQRAS